MGFRFYKRINLGGGFGFNLSKSGISPSFRTKMGSISPKGFSARTGIPGASYRSSFGKGSGCLVIVFLFLSLIAMFVHNSF